MDVTVRAATWRRPLACDIFGRPAARPTRPFAVRDGDMMEGEKMTCCLTQKESHLRHLLSIGRGALGRPRRARWGGVGGPRPALRMLGVLACWRPRSFSQCFRGARTPTGTSLLDGQVPLEP